MHTKPAAPLAIEPVEDGLQVSALQSPNPPVTPEFRLGRLSIPNCYGLTSERVPKRKQGKCSTTGPNGRRRKVIYQSAKDRESSLCSITKT